MEPLGPSKRLKVSTVFPRDAGVFPVLSVQIDSVDPASESLGRLISGGPDKAETKRVRGVNYNISISIVAWCNIPEDRDDIALWLGSAQEILVELLQEFGFLDPSANLSESEDFETLKVPLFLATGRVNTSRWSALTTAAPREYGQLISS
jgi:hypothetical protein